MAEGCGQERSGITEEPSRSVSAGGRVATPRPGEEVTHLLQ